MSGGAPRHLAISDRRRLPAGDVTRWSAAVAAAGVQAVQVREKDLSDRRLLHLCEAAVATLQPPTPLLVNGRADIAVAAAAAGVHLPARGVSTRAVRAAFGDAMLIGRSTHSVEEIVQARDEGADYVVYGPVWPVPGKEHGHSPVGLYGLEEAARLGIPVLALGGVGRGRLAEVAATGVHGVAGIRLFLDTAVLAEIVAELDRLLSR